MSSTRPASNRAARRAGSLDRGQGTRDLLIARCVEDDAKLLCEELPYPVLGLRYYDDEDPVVLANATVRNTLSRRALNMAVFTSELAAYHRVASRVDAYKVLHNASPSALDPRHTHQGMHLFLELLRPSDIL